MKVFIVDDDHDFAQSQAIFLEIHGHEVEIAHSGEEAIEKFRDQDFDLTLMDVRLPGMSGVESFFEIRRLKPDAKVLMMTAYRMEQLLEQAVEGGAVGVLHKPFRADELLNALSAIQPVGMILIAEDDADFAQTLELLLRGHGYVPLIAHTGLDAVSMVLANPIDVLILDLRLPLLDGLGVYLELRNQQRVIPTILITAYADEEMDQISALRALDITGIFFKPFDPAALLQAITELL